MVGDTSIEAQRRQDAVFRSMGPQRRVAAAVEMSESVFAIAREGIRTRHPEYTDEEVLLTSYRLRLGDALFRAAFPHGPILPA